jgi:hypothetical protein
VVESGSGLEETIMTGPTIEGTYRLVRRDLPDGTTQLPPAVKGMFTYTEEFRNFSVVWRDDQGRYYSECYVARYTLSDKEYTETSEYLIVNNEIEASGISYDLSANGAKSPVAIDGERIRFALPQPFERALSIVLEFEGARLQATAEGQFVDHWEKVG